MSAPNLSPWSIGIRPGELVVYDHWTRPRCVLQLVLPSRKPLPPQSVIIVNTPEMSYVLREVLDLAEKALGQPRRRRGRPRGRGARRAS